MTRKQAIQLVDNKISGILGGLTSEDLPDTFEMCNLYDTLEDMDESEAKELVNETIDFEFLEDLVYG